MRLGEDCYYKFRLCTGTNVPESLSNMMDRASSEELWGVLDGCEWDAYEVAEALNSAHQILLYGDWNARRTLPRKLTMEGFDPFGNLHVLHVLLEDSEPDAFDGYDLSLHLYSRSDVPLSTSNIISSGHYVEDFRDYLFDAADAEWSAESLAEAAQLAYEDGVTYNSGWHAKYTRGDKCCIESVDGFGNEQHLVVKMF